MTPRPRTLLASALLVFSACANVATADTVLFSSTDVDKNGQTIHLGLLGMSFTLEGAGMFAYDSATGLANYTAVVSNGTSGFEIELNLMDTMHAPRCFQGDCANQWYIDNGVDPANDWTMLVIDPENINRLTGFGGLAGTVLTVLANEYFQFGLGAGGWNVTPEGLAFSGWFDLRDETGTNVGAGDINGNLSQVPVPGALVLFASALFGMASFRRRDKRS